MGQESEYEAVEATMRRINRFWLDGDVEALVPIVHPEIVMLFPGFTGRIQGREEFLAGFPDFCQTLRSISFKTMIMRLMSSVSRLW